MLARARYRGWQVWQLVWAQPLSAAAWQEIAGLLNEAEQQLFRRFGKSDQQHGYRVMRLLWESGQTERPLLVAALLHDIGKICYPVWLWDRILIVLIKAAWPEKLVTWGQGEAKGWKRPFVIREQHPAWGAELAQQAGTSPLAVRLIARHQDPLPEPLKTEEDTLLAQLQWADDQN